MSDDVRENAKKGSLDRMASVGKAALTVGVGAALFYRGGGNKILSQGTRISEKVLTSAKNEIGSLDFKNLNTGDIKKAFNSVLGASDSALVKAKEEVASGPIRLRKDDPRNILGALQKNYTQLMRDQDKILRRKFESAHVKYPSAQEFVKRYGQGDPELGRQLERFAFDATDNLNDAYTVSSIAEKLKLDKELGSETVNEMVEFMRERMQDDNGYAEFKQQHKDTIDEALRKALDPDEIARVTGSAANPTARQKFESEVLGDTRATVDDILENAQKFEDNFVVDHALNSEGKRTDVTREAADYLRRLKEKVAQEQGEDKAAAFGQLYVDGSLRKDRDGNFYSFAEALDITEATADRAANTLPGKVFKLREFLEPRKAPSFHYTPASGSVANPILAKLANKGDKSSLLPDTDIMRIYNRSYEFSSDGLEHVKALDNTYLLSRYGTLPRLTNQIAGNTDHRHANSRLAQIFDIGQSGSPTMLDDFKSKLNKFDDPSWSRNAVNTLLNDTAETRDMLNYYKENELTTGDAAKQVNDVITKIKSVNTFLSKNTYELSTEAVNKLAEEATGESRQLFNMLKLNDEDMLREIMTTDTGSLRDPASHLNQDLISLLNKYQKDPQAARNMISQKSNRTNFFGGKETGYFFDTLRMELGKEAFMQQAINTEPGSATYDFDSITQLIDNANLSGESKREATRLANWAAFQQAGEVNARMTNNKTTEQLIDTANQALAVFMEPEDKTETNAEFFKQFRESLERMSKEKTSLFEESYSSFQEATDITTAYRQDNYMVMQKAVSPLDVLKDLNDTEKMKAFGKQFYAGRNNLEDVTTATLVPYFAAARIPDALGKIGLNFSTTSMGSLGDVTTAMVFKRGLPLVVGATYLSYLNDMTGAVTGTSMTGAFASGMAHMDLGMRSITDATGLTKAIQTEKEINPFLSYYTGDEYMGREEREEWYQNGYQEMRKGRWWNFGGIQEWRGTQIQYFQPNYLRRAHSDWKDKALYDSVHEKWSRSWLPTPTAPLSPLRYLMNPYWLEQKHAEDRPYPMSAPMFTEETPWGAVLNPTVGEIIKPKRRMHRDRLGSNLVDARALIESRNMAEFEKARSNNESHMIRFSDGVIEPVNYTTLAAPTPSQRVLQMEIGGGGVNAQDVGSYQMHTGVMSAQAFMDPEEDENESGLRAGTSSYGSNYVGGFVGGSSDLTEMSFKEDMEMRSAQGEFLPSIISQTIQRTDPTQGIASVNRGIRARAQLSTTRPVEEGVITPETIYRSQARFGSQVLDNREAVADLVGLQGGDDFIGELAYTSRYALGIYGYGAYRMFPGQPRKKLEDASQMTSPVRSLWDSNLGGMGGGYAEIFRRFVPSQNHNVEKINPLLNTMPDWMPERFRFGDPYTILPKGEMRLPGKGFESLHNLNPDMYGEYGAFDRFKILADIAPYSSEYKVWRDIATRTVEDPELKEEMQAIRERVTKQSQKYDFHDYKFIGKKVERNRVIVEEVLSNNHFKVMGDDRVYRMAGINVTGEQGEDFLSQYLTPGSEVVMGVDTNPYDGTNDDQYQSVSAAIYIKGQNLNKQLLDEGMASKRENDTSAAASQGMYTDFQVARGHFFEALAHAPIPYYQQKFFKMRDPLESYKHELTYGTTYASWNQPIKSFLQPGFERSLMDDKEIALGVGALLLNNTVHHMSESAGLKNASNAALMLTNRGAFIGGFIGIAAGGGGDGARNLAQLGAAAQMTGWAVTRSDQPVEATVGFAAIGAAVGYKIKDIGIEKGAAVGAIAGLAISAAQTSLWHEGIDKTWIPERTREKWEMQEYFDRLEYIKYSGLYEKAARRARILEGTDIKRLVHQYETSRETNEEIRQELTERKSIVQDTYAEGDSRAQQMIAEIDDKINALQERDSLLTTGKWGRSALIYKQAMDSTIYGLGEDASWAQLLRALPSNERDHFIEFSKEKDPEKREEILKYVSPYQKRALQIAWGEEPDKPESMSSFFANHELPGATWSGWRPNVDLKNVQVKTIKNEGMLLSDFGLYDSELRNPDVIAADSIGYNDPNNAISLRANLISTLQGFGLTGVNVNVEPRTKMGVEVVADVIKMNTYSAQQRVRDVFRR